MNFMASFDFELDHNMTKKEISIATPPVRNTNYQIDWAWIFLKMFKVQLYLHRILFCALFFFLPGSVFAQNYDQIAGSGFDEGGWAGYAMYDTSTGLFDHCIAATFYDNHKSLMFLVGNREEFALVLPTEASQGVVDVTLYVDDLPSSVTTGAIGPNNSIIIPLSHISNAIGVFRHGKYFTYEINGVSQTYTLRGTALGLSAAESCAKKYYLYLAPNSKEASSNSSEPKADSVEQTGKTGTGFYVSLAGYVLTNNHVISGCKSVQVDDLDAVVVNSSESPDLALLKVFGAKYFHTIEFSDVPANLNEDITVAGFPYAGILNGLNITRGTVSSAGGISGDSTMFQISAPVQPGNSGGAVVNSGGLAVGVVVAKLNPVIEGNFPENVNFAIRGDLARKFLKESGVEPSLGSKPNDLDSTSLADILSGATVFIQCE